MTRVVFVDVVGGAAGDMLLAALLDAGAPQDLVQEAIDAVLSGRFRIATEEVRRQGLRARLLRIRPDAESGPPRSLPDLLAAVDGGALDPPVRRRARAVLERLAEAEARVHGVEVDDLAAHDLGDDDTLVDVVGVSAALAALEADRVAVSSIPLRTGGLLPARGDHGSIPLPAPATIELLRGFALRPAPEQLTKETLTPTAAAIFAALGEPAQLPEMQLDSVGYGAGNDDPTGAPNVVRVLVGSVSGDAAAGSGRPLSVLEANIDDLTPELLADAAGALLSAGALDVWTTPVNMKKGRPGIVLSVLCDPEDGGRLTELFFRSTTTFGVRAHSVRRQELERRTVALSVLDGSVRVKVGLLEGRAVTAAPEHDDVSRLAERVGRPVREVHQLAAAAASALLDEDRPAHHDRSRR